MKKVISLLMILIILIMPAMAKKKSIKRTAILTKDEQICNSKDQNTVETLLQTVFACQNIQRTPEVIDLVFLGNPVNDQLLGLSELDELLIPNQLRDERISLKAWRAKKLEEFTEMDNKGLQKITLLEVSKPSMHDQNPFQYHSDQSFEKALVRYAFTTNDKNAGNEEIISPQIGQHLIIFLNGKVYLNQLPFDLWELDY